MPVTYKECRYCNGQRPTTCDTGETVCGGCGAEWDPIDVVYSDTEMQDMYDELERFNRGLEEDSEE